MHDAWEIIKTAFRQGSANYGKFFKAWFLTMLILVGLMSWWGVKFFQALNAATYSNVYPDYTQFGWFGFAIAIFALIVGSGLAVNSLRILLDDEYTPSWIPFAYDWRRSFRYLGQYILLDLLYFIITILPIMLWLFAISDSIADGHISFGNLIIGGVLFFCLSVLAIWIVARLYNALVATAVGRKLSFSQAWKKTAKVGSVYFGAIIFVMFISYGIAIFVPAIFQMLSGILPSLGVFLLAIFPIIAIFLYIWVCAVLFALFATLYKKYCDD